MANLVTLTSDFGTRDEYVSLVKGAIMSSTPKVQIIDLNHQIPAFNIMAGARFLEAAHKSYPNGTIHVLLVHTHYAETKRWLIHEVKNQVFIAPDNGLLSLIFPKVTTMICMDQKETYYRDIGSLIEIVHSGKWISLESCQIQRYLSPSLRASKKGIMGIVMHIDHYGNAITNIDRHTFEVLASERDYTIRFGREVLKKIHTSYVAVEPGDCLLSFNEQGYLQISISMGKADTLLGLRVESPVTIQIKEE